MGKNKIVNDHRFLELAYRYDICIILISWVIIAIFLKMAIIFSGFEFDSLVKYPLILVAIFELIANLAVLDSGKIQKQI